MKISVILPTRKRPEQAQRFLSSLNETCSNPSKIEIILLTDDDDDSYQGLNSPFKLTNTISGRRRGLGEITYDGIQRSTGEIIFLCNDDVEAQTPGWDDALFRIHKSFADGVYLMSPNDLNKSDKLFVFPVFSRRLSGLLGDFPKAYNGAFIDSHIHEIFKSLKFRGLDRMVYLDHVKFQHKHFRVTGEVPDTTYKERDRFADDWTFFSSVGIRKQSSDRLINIIKKQPEQNQHTERYFGILQASLVYLDGKYVPLFIGIKILLYLFARWLYKIASGSK